MYRNVVLWFLLLSGMVMSSVSFGADSARPVESPPAAAPVIASVKDLAGKRAASLTGAGFQPLTEPFVAGVEYLFFNDNTASVQALRSGRADAVLLDEPVARLYAAENPELRVACVYAEDFYGFAFPKNSSWCEKASAVIRELKRSGELERLVAKWCGADPAKKRLEHWTHKKDFTGKNGTFRYGSDPVLEPMCYSGPDGDPVGLDLEIMRRIAYELDMEFEFVPMNFGSLIEALAAGRVDAVGGAMSITEERKKKVDFAECYYVGGLTILARAPEPAPGGVTKLAQLDGKRIGVFTGTVGDQVARSVLPKAVPVYLNSFNEQVIALETGKVDAFIMEEPQARLLLRQKPHLTQVPELLSHDDYAFVFSLEHQPLCDRFSEVIRGMKADGTLKKLEDKWFAGGETVPALPPPAASAPNGVLRCATVPQFEPFTFLSEGEVTGYDIEVAQLAAEKLGYRLEPVIMDWNGFLPAIAACKVDFGAGCITVTGERKKMVAFAEPDYRGGLCVIVMNAAPDAVVASGWRQRLERYAGELAASFDRTFIKEDRWKLIASGLEVTVIITVLAALFGTLLAFGVCAMRRAKSRWWSLPARWYVSLMQGVPMLVILMILYYIVFAGIDIPAVIVAVIGFALNFAAYTGEMMRTAIDGVDKGQLEAAKALGFGRFAIFCKVVFPQAARRVLPVYKGEFINMLKTTSIVGYIAIQDLTKMSDIIRSRTYEAFFPLIATAVIYFAAAHLLASFLSLLEFKLDPQNRRRAEKGAAVR